MTFKRLKGFISVRVIISDETLIPLRTSSNSKQFILFHSEFKPRDMTDFVFLESQHLLKTFNSRMRFNSSVATVLVFEQVGTQAALSVFNVETVM